MPPMPWRIARYCTRQASSIAQGGLVTLGLRAKRLATVTLPKKYSPLLSSLR